MPSIVSCDGIVLPYLEPKAFDIPDTVGWTWKTFSNGASGGLLELRHSSGRNIAVAFDAAAVSHLTNPTSLHSASLEMFPNPARSVVTISFKTAQPAKLEVLDVLGRTIYSRSVGRATQSSGSVQWHAADASGGALTDGAYFVQLKTQSGVSISKLLMLVR